MTILTLMNAEGKTLFGPFQKGRRTTPPAKIYCKIVKEIKETTGACEFLLID